MIQKRWLEYTDCNIILTEQMLYNDGGRFNLTEGTTTQNSAYMKRKNQAIGCSKFTGKKWN